MAKNKQSNEVKKEGNGWLGVKKGTKRIWVVGIAIILISIGWIVLVGPWFDCADRGKYCTLIKGEVLDEEVLTMGGGTWCDDTGCRKTPIAPISNTYSVKVLEVYHGDVRGGQEIIVDNYQQSFVKEKLEIGKIYKMRLLIDTPEEITEGFLFESQKKSIYEYFTGQHQLALYFGYYHGKQLREPWHVLTTLPIMIIALIATILLVTESILVRLVTVVFVVWFVLPMLISNLISLIALLMISIIFWHKRRK